MHWQKCILAATLVLSVLAYVAEAEHKKREVHQIVIEEPRVKRRPHHRYHHHSQHSRSKGHKKKVKKPPRNSSSSEENSSSFEDSDSKSNENSYEEIQVEMRHKGSKYQRPASTHVPHYPPQLDVDETQTVQFRENLKPFYQPEWVAVPQDQFYSKPPERNGRKKRKDGRNKKLPPKHNFNLDYAAPPPHRKPFGPPLPPFNLDLPMNLHPKPMFNADMAHNQNPIFGFEFTTSLPLQYEATTHQLYPVYPTLNPFSNQYQEYSGSKTHISDSHISPLIGTIEQPKVDYLSQSASNIYEVTESASEIQKVYISVPDDVKENETGGEKVETTTVSTTTTTNKPQTVRVNNRGKFRRGRPKF
ncbi:unnamed protein product [Callosobruchus maculatus]|uniref:Uncharacterized protein n=1 Tax=Callosobruchus maculatus TaxID=64391 RepID=A0A653DDR5_CALMS|nr:unnamed protein product [Callosobruchus maculatus]